MPNIGLGKFYGCGHKLIPKRVKKHLLNQAAGLRETTIVRLHFRVKELLIISVLKHSVELTKLNAIWTTNLKFHLKLV